MLDGSGDVVGAWLTTGRSDVLPKAFARSQNPFWVVHFIRSAVSFSTAAYDEQHQRIEFVAKIRVLVESQMESNHVYLAVAQNSTPPCGSRRIR